MAPVAGDERDAACPACAHRNPAGASFCQGCGARLGISCVSCGERLPASAKFCHECGQAQPAATATSAASASRDAASSVSPPFSGRRSPESLPASFAAGRYRIQRLLGEGAKKRVYLAHDARLDRQVALGLLRTERLDEQARERLQREARAMGVLGNHPHVVTIFDVGEEDGQPYIVSDYMAGGSLDALLAEAPDHRLAVSEALRVAEQICGALEHAHRRGVIHRDLKPGNVFLDAGGAVQLGDFGLALGSEATRLTREGGMLGTPSYMPPEQAVGSEVSVRSDLYSLGCVLYELIAGRPPFVGDDPVAVISQHLNTAPVAPSWHRPECPLELERLILQLLAKPPADRPLAAGAVGEILAAIDPSAAPVAHPADAAPNPLERLARGVFVGREQETAVLRQALERSLRGRGEIVVLAGEPGIGKTRTALELETYGRMRGAQVLWGRSHEASGAPAYWPWIQVGRAWGASNDLTQLPPGAGGAELRRLFPELRRLAPDAPEPEEIGDSEAAQFRLFDAYASFLRGAAELQPLVVVLDDLQWADQPSLELLEHFGRELDHMAILLVATYRDVDLDRTHPLSRTLAALNRAPGLRRLVLRGLSREEVASYIQRAAGVEPAPAVLERIVQETEGNPFFLSEVVNLMAQEGTLDASSVTDVAIPDGVREALGRRLELVSAETSELLEVAAVVGREFRYPTLALVLEADEEALLRSIEEALAARVIEEMTAPGRYRFTHALMQETLLDELSTTRRTHLHGRIGEALERRWGEQAEERASTLARHFVAAAALTERHAAKAIRYSRRAAEQAQEQAGWAEAARHYGDCLALVGAGELEPAERAGLLTALGTCARLGGDYRTAWRSLRQAIDLYGEDDPVGMGRATLEVLGIHAEASRRRALLDRALETLGSDQPELEARLLLAWLSFGDGDEAIERPEVLSRARLLVEEHGLDELLGDVEFAESQKALMSGQFEGAVERARSAFQHFEAERSPDRAAMAACQVGCWSFSQHDEVDRAESDARWALEQARRLGVEIAEQNALLRLSGVALARAELDRFHALLDEMPGDNFTVDMQRADCCEWRGDQEGALAHIPSETRIGTASSFVAFRASSAARVLFHAGRVEEARQELDKVMRIWAGAGVGRRWTVANLDDALSGLPERHELELMDREVARWLGRWDPIHARSWERLQGEIALDLGRLDEAREKLTSALAWTSAQRLPIEAGRCHEALARLEAGEGDEEAALRHLNHAIRLYQRHGIRRFLERALAEKIRLEGQAPQQPAASMEAVATSVERRRPDLASHTAPDGTVTLMFSDMEGSTEMLERLGDRRAHEVIRRHNAIVRGQLARHGGHEVELQGDGFLLAFPSALRAAECAVAIQRAFVEHNEHTPAEPIRVRIGLHTGEAIREADKFFGKTVVLAYRIADQARAGEILLSALSRELVASRGDLVFDDEREVQLKGLEGTHRVCALHWQ